MIGFPCRWRCGLAQPVSLYKERQDDEVGLGSRLPGSGVHGRIQVGPEGKVLDTGERGGQLRRQRCRRGVGIVFLDDDVDGAGRPVRRHRQDALVSEQGQRAVRHFLDEGRVSRRADGFPHARFIDKTAPVQVQPGLQDKEFARRSVYLPFADPAGPDGSREGRDGCGGILVRVFLGGNPVVGAMDGKFSVLSQFP